MMGGKPQPIPWHPDWRSVPDEAVEHLLKEAKEHLQGTIEIGINADQRATALCSVFGGGAFALFAVSATVFAGEHADVILLGATVVAGGILLVASLICAWAAAPSDFYVSGYEPRELFAANASVIWMKIFTIEDIQRRIEANRIEINREANLVKLASRVTAIGILVVSLSTLAFKIG